MPLRPRRAAALKASEAIAAESNDSSSMSLPRQDRYRDSSSSSKPQVSFSGEPPSSPSKNDGTLRMTVKMPPAKLAGVGSSGRTGGTRGVAQKVTKSSGTRGVAQPRIKVSSRENFEGGEILESKRKREVKKSYVVESDSDEDDEVEEEDAMDVDEDEDDDDEEDAEGEEDEDMSGQPPPRPIIKSSKAANNGKTTITAKPQPAKKEVRPVETKEMENSDSDEELSELGSDIEDETMMMGEEDADGDEEEVEVEEDDEEEDDDSDLDTPGGGSRASTPDLSKLTRRQRARLEEGGSGHLLALPDEVQVKKHLTAEEHAMRRAEMARRRKNLSEKRNEEEKMETINKLLKKQAPKTNARRKELNGEGGSTDNGEPGKPNPIFTRWISNKEGNSVSVPNEWLEAPVGEVFKNGIKQENKQGVLEGAVGQEVKEKLLGGLEGGKMVEEVQ